MEYVKDRELFSNPYIIQMDRFAESLKHLSETFLYLEDYKGSFTKDEIEEMFRRVSERVCTNCEKRNWCLCENRIQTCQMVCEILCTAEEFGAELNVEIKRKLQKKCDRAPRFLRETLEVFGDAKQKLLWNNRIVQNREGCARSLISFADTISQAARELGAGIYSDERLEKKIVNQLKKVGIRVISSVFYMTKAGKCEVHLTLKAAKGHCVATREMAKIVSNCVGRSMYPEAREQPIIWEEYTTIILREAARYHPLQGVAKIGKGCEQISGDTFLMTYLPGGRESVMLSDGMGSGEEAFRESAMVVEMAEELLVAGFPEKMAIQLLNTALVMGREEVYFSTVDMCVFDLYEGSCKFLKAGASTTFIRHGGEVEKITSTTLPVGVMQNIEIDCVTRKLSDGDFVVMVTDGVMDALPVGEQEAQIGGYLCELSSQNPKEMAHHVLERVLESTGELPMDDMTVIVIGIWEM